MVVTTLLSEACSTPTMLSVMKQSGRRHSLSNCDFSLQSPAAQLPAEEFFRTAGGILGFVLRERLGHCPYSEKQLGESAGVEFYSFESDTFIERWVVGGSFDAIQTSESFFVRKLSQLNRFPPSVNHRLIARGNSAHQHVYQVRVFNFKRFSLSLWMSRYAALAGGYRSDRSGLGGSFECSLFAGLLNLPVVAPFPFQAKISVISRERRHSELYQNFRCSGKRVISFAACSFDGDPYLPYVGKIPLAPKSISSADQDHLVEVGIKSQLQVLILDDLGDMKRFFIVNIDIPGDLNKDVLVYRQRIFEEPADRALPTEGHRILKHAILVTIRKRCDEITGCARYFLSGPISVAFSACTQSEYTKSSTETDFSTH